MQAGVNMSDEQMLLEVLDERKFQFAAKKNKMGVSIDGVDVTDQIRGPEVTANAKHIACAPKVREKLVEMQRQFAAGEDKIVTEGRDQGTVAFPNADIKFYLTAQTIERARRRAKDEGRTTQAEIEQIQRNIEVRDASDQNRAVGPLTPAADAIIIDTTDLTAEEVVEKLRKMVIGKSPITNYQSLKMIWFRLTRWFCKVFRETIFRLHLRKMVIGESLITNYQSLKMIWFRFERWFFKVFRETIFRLHLAGRKNIPDWGPLVLICNRQSFLDLVTNYQSPKMRWPRFARWLCKVFCETIFRLHPAGRENVPDQGPLVLVCNHQSFLDPVFCGIFVKRPLYYLARDTLFRGLFGRLLVSIQTIPVKRGEADLAAMRIVISKLKQGNGVCLFPEGTRTSDGRITPFKPGFGLLCRRGGAAVVPVVIDGAFEAWPRHKKLFSPGGHIAIHYGKCISAGEVKKMDDRELAKLLTDTLRQMQNDCRVNQGKEPYCYR
jgi:cytidylate kinase